MSCISSFLQFLLWYFYTDYTIMRFSQYHETEGERTDIDKIIIIIAIVSLPEGWHVW